VVCDFLPLAQRCSLGAGSRLTVDRHNVSPPLFHSGARYPVRFLIMHKILLGELLKIIASPPR